MAKKDEKLNLYGDETVSLEDFSSAQLKAFSLKSRRMVILFLSVLAVIVLASIIPFIADLGIGMVLMALTFVVGSMIIGVKALGSIKKTLLAFLEGVKDIAPSIVIILLAFSVKYIADNGITLKRGTYVHVTVYEEVGHGGSGSVPAGVTEAISVDMGCVGDGLQCSEKQVSICAKDSGGPYSYEVVGKLIEAAKKTEADYAVDVYPHYGSDVEATLRAGFDIRHGLIGSGVYASHGYERSHIDGVYNTLKVLAGYLDLA
jgi:hypothetical protein